ncbi:hypothetical protein C8Q74DRAFT_707026 [Fomes fomentarius]|nr:hypothetical protein C8Q74DRAFT_707026 [Fomes fomentarius]
MMWGLSVCPPCSGTISSRCAVRLMSVVDVYCRICIVYSSAPAASLHLPAAPHQKLFVRHGCSSTSGFRDSSDTGRALSVIPIPPYLLLLTLAGLAPAAVAPSSSLPLTTCHLHICLYLCTRGVRLAGTPVLIIPLRPLRLLYIPVYTYVHTYIRILLPRTTTPLSISTTSHCPHTHTPIQDRYKLEDQGPRLGLVPPLGLKTISMKL